MFVITNLCLWGGKPCLICSPEAMLRAETAETLRNSQRRRDPIQFCPYCILTFMFEARPCYIQRWKIILKYWLVIVISLLMDLVVIMLTPVALLTSTKLNQTIDLLLKIDSVFLTSFGCGVGQRF